MLLAIDLGNTQTHIGMFRGEDLVENWRLATVRETTGDELATLLVSLLELRDLRLRDVDDVILSSVVPQLTPEYERLAERYLPGSLTVVGPGMKTGMAIRTERPQELGTDRLCNAVAAYEKCGGACVVVVVIGILQMFGVLPNPVAEKVKARRAQQQQQQQEAPQAPAGSGSGSETGK